jgi:hypothetical protein
MLRLYALETAGRIPLPCRMLASSAAREKRENRGEIWCLFTYWLGKSNPLRYRHFLKQLCLCEANLSKGQAIRPTLLKENPALHGVSLVSISIQVAYQQYFFNTLPKRLIPFCNSFRHISMSLLVSAELGMTKSRKWETISPANSVLGVSTSQYE